MLAKITRNKEFYAGFCESFLSEVKARMLVREDKQFRFSVRSGKEDYFYGCF